MDAVCSHLEAQGWTVEQRLDTHQRGIDIIASRGGRRLLIEAKGATGADYGSKNYGSLFDDAHTHVSVAEAARLVGQHPSVNVVIALPETPAYQKYVEQVSVARERLRLGVFWLAGEVAHLTTWVPEDIGKHCTIKDVRNTARLELLRRGGVQVSRAVQTIGACPLPKTIAVLLDAPPKSPGVRMTRIVEDRLKRVVEYCVAYSPWDRYEYRVVME